jgi:DNA polymerase
MSEPLLNELRDTLAAARSQLEYLKDLGVEHLETSTATAGQGQQDAGPQQSTGTETLEDIRRDLGDCRRCELAASRTQLVYGVGNPDARLVLVGEAPGREEDLRGEPFVGEAGRLLDRILAAMGMCRADTYICNVLKCRPPNNRDPMPEEVATCEPFLLRQIAAIKPQVIVGLGRFAVHSLLKTRVPISQLRGEWQDYHGIPLMPTYHPAYLLRNPEGKREVWEDMKAVLRLMNSGGKDQ